jgi:hypothetical protein
VRREIDSKNRNKSSVILIISLGKKAESREEDFILLAEDN